MRFPASRLELPSWLYRQAVPAAGALTVGSLLALLLTQGRNPGYWVVAIEALLPVLFVFPEVFLGIYQGGILENIRFLPAGTDSRFLPFLTAAVAAAYLARRWPRLPRITPNLMLVSQFVLWALFIVGLSYSSEPDRGLTFVTRFAYYHLLLLALPFLFHDDPKTLRRLIYAFGATSMLVGLSSLLAFQKLMSQAVIVYSEVLAVDERILGSGVIFVEWLLVSQKKLGFWRLPLAAVLVVLFFSVALLGRRGILIGTVLAALLCPVLAGRLRPKGIAGLGLAIAVLFLSFQLIPGFQQSKLFDEESYTGTYTSTQARVTIFNDAIGEIQESLILGYGTGAGAITGLGEGITPYLHNIFLEIGYQVGIIGVLVFCLFLFGVAISSLRIVVDGGGGHERRNLGILLLGWFIVFLVPAQLSYDLMGNRTLWFIAGLIGAVCASPPAAWRKDRVPNRV